MKVLIKTLCGENSSVYTIAEGNRIRLADCQVKIELYEHSQRVSTLGVPGGRIKQTHSVEQRINTEPNRKLKIQ